MKSILEELWYGNICPFTDCYESSEESKVLASYIDSHRNALQASLNDEQKKILEKLEDCTDELTEIKERKLFTYAFRLGARITMDVMGKKENEK